jgi:hypothetical protein
VGERVDAWFDGAGSRDWWTAEVLAVSGEEYQVMFDDQEHVGRTTRVRAPEAGARVGASSFATDAARTAYLAYRRAEIALEQLKPVMSHLLRFLVEGIVPGGDLWLLGRCPSLARRCVAVDAQYDLTQGIVVYKPRPIVMMANENVPIVDDDSRALVGLPRWSFDIGGPVSWPSVRVLGSPSEVLGDKSIDDVAAIRAIAATTGASCPVSVIA